MAILRSTALVAALVAASFSVPSTTFAQSNQSTIVQGGTNSVNTAVSQQRGRNNDSLTIQAGDGSDNLAVTDQKGCNNTAAIGQIGEDSINTAGVVQKQRRRC